ncbi:hypothetical protein BGZ72_000171 [Mortierella alpina]|nr:hypothetical protein BGZ72_000171 [Mortierella alpina]
MKITPVLSAAALIAAIAPSLALPSKRGAETLDILGDEFTSIVSSQPMVDQEVFSRPYPHHPPSSLSILSNNVFLLGAVPWEQQTRARLIAKAEYIKNHDVVVLQECFRNKHCSDLKQGLRSEYPYATPSVGDSKAGWLSTSGKFSRLSPENGGVSILSKWPITKMRQFIYMSGCGWDKLSNKGVAYAELNIQGTKVHVFGTHMQSNDKLCAGDQAAQIRAQALDDFYYFVVAQRIPQDELVVMVGDFNIDRDTREYERLLKQLHVARPTYFKGAQWSYDTKQNGIARARDSTEPSQNLDHILVSTQHKMPTSVVETTLLVHSTPYAHGSEIFNDFSDHYPVQATINL